MFLNFNGEVREEGIALLQADNRGFRYGDGLFETMLVRKGLVRLGPYHFERLAGGLHLLRLELPRSFSLDNLMEEVRELCARNGCDQLARARLTVFRAGGGLYNVPDRRGGYIIQTSLLGENPGSWGGGVSLGVFPGGRKACDVYSAIKSNNYQLSTQAGMFGGDRGWDDCVLLNSHGRVAETTIANIWWIREGTIFTPPLSEGCVAGVMRRWLLEVMPAAGYPVREEPIGPDELARVNEIFLSNAIRGIRWVRDFGGQQFGCRLSSLLHDQIVSKI